MARNRKTNKAKEDKKLEANSPLLDIPENEQWRIIRDSGILQQPLVNDRSETTKDEPLLSPLTEEIFAALALIIPHCFLLLLMDILAHYQYGKKPTYEALSERMITGVPIICICIFYTNRYVHTQQVQLLLLAMSSLCGSRMIYLLNHANWRDVMKLTPPLATAWVYAVVQLNLGNAVLSLLLVGGWIWYKKLTILPNF